MDWGSQYVLEYDASSDEYISEGELEEGMWLSGDEDDEQASSYLRPVSPPPVPAVPTVTYEEGSDSSDDELEDDDRGETRVKTGQPAADERSPGKYAALAKMKQEIREQAIRQSPVAARGAVSEIVSPTNDDQLPSAAATPRNYSDTVPHPPMAPPRPLKGIMKAAPVKRQRKARVRWDKSYRSKESSSHRARRQDTNVLAVQFSTLAQPGHIHTGDAEFCSNGKCGAIVSHLSTIVGQDENKKWVCEFCGTSNTVDLVPEEIPTEEDTTYLITAAGAVQDVGGASTEESMVVFCTDTSGSMCVTTEVTGRYVLRGAAERKKRMLSSLPTDLDVDVRRAELQFAPGQRRDTTWISRMESVQAAVETQLAQLAHTQPDKKACLVTFSDDVVVVGDGRMAPVTVAGDKLKSSEALVKIARDLPMPAAIRDTHKALAKRLFSLEESGQTALGPAVVMSVMMASKVPGSKVIVCTDGLANVGLGALDDIKDDERYAHIQSFYEDLGTLAMEKGVTVSLVSIRGQECRVAELGQVTTRTRGSVTIVDPHTVTEEFTSILANPIIATDTVSRVILHSGLYFRREDSRESVIVHEVGNATADTELTYEYGVRTDKHQSGKPLMINGQPHFPFQLQIEYTSPDGDRCLRVITQSKPVTKDRDVAEKDMVVGVIGSHVAKQTASLAMEGEFTTARVKSLQAQRMIHIQSRTSAQKRWEYTNFCENVTPIENELHRMQAREQHVYGHNVSDEEPEEFDVQSSLSRLSMDDHSRKTRSSPGYLVPKSKPKKTVSRRRDMSDELSEGLFNLRHSSTQNFSTPQHSEPMAHRSTSQPVRATPPTKDDNPKE